MHKQQCVLAPSKCTQLRRVIYRSTVGQLPLSNVPGRQQAVATVVHVLLIYTLTHSSR